MRTKQESERARAALASAEANLAEATQEREAAKVALQAKIAAAIEAGVTVRVIDVDDTLSVRAERRVSIATAAVALAREAAKVADEAFAVERFHEGEARFRAALVAFSAALDAAREQSDTLVAIRQELADIHPKLAGLLPKLGWAEFGGRFALWTAAVTAYLTPPPGGPPKLTVVRALETFARSQIAYDGEVFAHGVGEIFQIDAALADALLAEGTVERVTA
jgi:hypothetical protein